jgi:Putative phage tail protein
MSLGGKKGQSTTDTRLEGINVNQSNYGNAIPLIYGQNRIPLMLLWYGNFIATPHTTSQGGGKGGGGGSSNTTFTYSASMIMGLCEGQINSVAQVWQDKVVSSLASLGLTLFTGAGGQAVWSYLTTNFPSQAVPYDHTAYVAVANLALGSSAALPNYTFEVTGFLPFNFGTVNDAEPSAILVDYCTDANHGANFGALNTSQFQGTGVLTWQSYCIAMGFFFSPYESTQRTAADFIKELMQLTNSDCWMSAGQLNIIPYADQSVTGNGKTYTPNLTPLFAFTDDDFMLNSASSGNDPVIVDRKPLADTYNTVVVEYLDRTNAYNVAIAQATDAQDIAVNGVRVMSTLTLHSITTGAVAQQVAQLILQRQLYIRSTFTFSVRADYCLLEPMDLVSITDTALGISNKLVRIIEVDDDQNDNITLIAEDMLVGSASAPLYNFQAAQGFAANYGVAPPAVATPLIFTAPPLLVGTAGGYEAWIAVDQSAAGSWGGADVYISLDGTSYIYAGTINGAARYGTLTASLASSADPDTTHTLAVVLTNPTTTVLQLVTGSAADYNNLRTLLYVDGEIMAYQTATLTSAGHYNLTTLRRGQYGSVPALHASSSSFARIDAGIFRVPYDPGMIGQTMHFKFCSFNVYGKATQTLAAATDYTHVLAATNAGQLTPGPLTLVGNGITINGNSAFRSAATTGNWDAAAYSVQAYANGAFASWRVLIAGEDVAFGLALNPTSGVSYTSIDYCILVDGASQIAIEELSVFVGLFGTYAPGDVLAVTYDGSFIRYLQNGALLYQRPAPANLILYFKCSIEAQGHAVSDIQFGSYGTATPVLYIARGNCLVSDENVTKQGGSAAWDSDVYSINRFQTCHVVFKTNNLTTEFIVGISQVVGASPGFATVDFGFLFTGGGALDIFEGGTNVGTFGTVPALTDFYAITYDGTTVTYWQNGNSLRTVAISGKTYFLTSGFFSASGGVNSLEFGPGSLIPLGDTAQINANAATTTSVTTAAGPTTVPTSFTTMLTQTIGPFPFASTLVITCGAQYDCTRPGAGGIGVFLMTEGIGTSPGGGVNKTYFKSNPTLAAGTSTDGQFTDEQTFALAANTTTTYDFYVLGNYAAPDTATISNMTMKVEVIKR